MIRAPEEDPFEHFDPLAGFLSDTSLASPQLDFPWLHHNVYRQGTLTATRVCACVRVKSID
jgi:hypothetical protein